MVNELAVSSFGQCSLESCNLHHIGASTSHFARDDRRQYRRRQESSRHPQSHVQKISETKMTTGFGVKRRPGNTGVMMLASKRRSSKYEADGNRFQGVINRRCVSTGARP